MQRKGQITIFIILGMVLLASAAFLYYIVSEITVSELESEQEVGIAGLFQKEGLRLFVEDCAKAALEDALIAVGEGGRIWYDSSQVENALSFSEDINGIQYQGNLFYLGITNDLDSIHPESYPCGENQTQSPTFCQYLNGDTGVFGKKGRMSFSDIESDIEKYLQAKTPTCVQEFLFSNLSYSGDLGAGEPEISVTIKSDGIDVDMEYPLELTVGTETYFHLTTFDYFYPSKLKSFLSKAVTRPLALELSDMDFIWTAAELENPTSQYYSSSYVSLAPILLVEEVEEMTEGLGHRIITYELEEDIILENQPYSFSFAIANRPPALDFIEREACIDYDYIAIPGNIDYGAIEIFTEAHDPDEDQIDFSFGGPLAELSGSGIIFDETPTEEEYTYNLTGQIPVGFLPETYTLTINATDAHGQSDIQDVRVLIDTPVNRDIYLENAYAARDQSVNTSYLGTPLLSTEDPFFVFVEVPSPSVSSDVTQEASLIYQDAENNGDFEANLHNSVGGSYCFSFPWTSAHPNCDIAEYTDEELELWPTLLEVEVQSHMNYSGPQGGPGLIGEFTLDFTRNYCGNFALSPEEETQEVLVVECLPLQNETHPFAYPYHRITRELDTNGKLVYSEEDISPFYATHSCCNTAGSMAAPNTFKDAGEICYNQPTDCQGNVMVNGHDVPKGFLQENVIDRCTGARGNVCGDVASGLSSTMEYVLPMDPNTGEENQLICGDITNPSCNKVDEDCSEVDAWGYPLDYNGDPRGWCHGTMGCDNLCPEYPVYIGTVANDIFRNQMSQYGHSINTLAENGWETDITENDFVCGCSDSAASEGDLCVRSDTFPAFDGVCGLDPNLSEQTVLTCQPDTN